MNIYKRFALAVAGLTLTVLVGTVGFHYFEDISFFDALWMTVESVLTIGYGDLVPQELSSKIFALFLIPLGIGVMTYTLGLVAALLIEGELSKTVRRRRMEDKIKRLRNHTIICGFGRVGQNVATQLLDEQLPFVIIDKSFDPKANPNLLYIEGDATEDEFLLRAGIDHASGLVATLPLDAENVFISLTAKGLNPRLQVVARAEKAESEEKLLRAGADKVINPSSIGGRRMAMAIIKPISVDFVDTLLHDKQDAYSVEELVIQDESKLAYKSIAYNRIREKYDATIVAIKRHDHILVNPKSTEILLPGDCVIVFGTKQRLTQFEYDSQNKT
ncbi:MAG TPA: potassium channel protein [Bacillota bacterium]|nr:potassium channel protein [Bacillota bacterium]